jgi:predicted acyltransferase
MGWNLRPPANAPSFPVRLPGEPPCDNFGDRTSTFVLTSGGWCLLALAFAYWLIDVAKLRRGWKFLAIVGMNPLFIYLFTETGGAGWFRGIARPFTEGIFGGLGDQAGAFATSFAVWAMLWGLCYALYRRKIFVRI